MLMRTTHTTYTSVAIAFHWLIALAIIGNLIGGLIHDEVPREYVGTIMSIHKATGITILVLSFARLAWRLTHKPPPLAPSVKRWEIGLSHAVHWTFYAAMIAIPMTGWLMNSAGSRRFPISWFGLFPIPFLPVAQDKGFANAMAYAHVYMSYALIALLALHISAAIKHHWFDHDDTVHRMAPWARTRAA